MSWRQPWLLAIGAGLLAVACSQSYSSIENIRCPTDLLCPGGLICLNGTCVNQHGSTSGGLGTTGGGGSSGSCVSCPEMFLQGSANGCDNSSAVLFDSVKTCACGSDVCDTDSTCQSNLCSTGLTLPSSGGIGGLGGGGMSEQCEACVAANCGSPFNACAFDPVNGHGTTGSVTTGGTTGGSGTTAVTACLGQGKACNNTSALCCSPDTCNSGVCSLFSTSTSGTSGSLPCFGGSAVIVGTGGNCLDDLSGDAEMETCNGQSNEVFFFQTDGTIVNDASLCLELFEDNTNLGQLDFASCEGTVQQQWSQSGSQILGPDGECLDVYADNTSPGATVDLTTCNGTAAQTWLVQCSGSTGATTTGSSGSTGGGSCSGVTVNALCASTNANCGATTTDCTLDGSDWTCYATTTCSTSATDTCSCATGSFTYTCATGAACTTAMPCGGSNPSYSCRTLQETEPGCTDSLAEVAGTCNCVGGPTINVSCGETTTCEMLCGG